VRQARRPHLGQALTEFLVLATFLFIPLLLLIPLIAGLISQKQDVEIAARYAAWERTAWNRTPGSGSDGSDNVKTDEQIANEIDARILAPDIEPVRSAVRAPTRLDALSYRPHDGQSMLAGREIAEGALARYAEQQSVDSTPGGLAGLRSETASALGSFTRFDLDDGGQIDATVSIDIVDLRPWFGLADVDLDQLRLTRSNRLFVEAWTGGAKRDVERTISGLLPQQFIDSSAARNIQDFAPFAPGAREVRSDWLRFGHVDIDPLPAYRVSSEAAPP
jgi:hypothetical protein